MRLILNILFLLAAISLTAQAHFEVAAKLAFGPTMMLNQSIFDDSQYDHTLRSGIGYGAKFGVGFSSGHGFTFDYIRATSKQDFEVDGQTGTANAFEWTHNDFLIMWRYSGPGVYVELGPKFSLISKVEQSILSAPPGDATAFFADNYTSAVLGFGSYFAGSDLVTFQVGVRLHYSFDDMISQQGMAVGTPGIALYSPYEKTQVVAAQLNFEINYAFGRFAKANCGDRNKLILFR